MYDLSTVKWTGKVWIAADGKEVPYQESIITHLIVPEYFSEDDDDGYLLCITLKKYSKTYILFFEYCDYSSDTDYEGDFEVDVPFYDPTIQKWARCLHEDIQVKLDLMRKLFEKHHNETI